MKVLDNLYFFLIKIIKHKSNKMDRVDNKTRSRIMSKVPSKNTKLEIELRRRLFKMGFRFRIHKKNLPGKPDLVFPKYNAVLFINGCFWHMHDCPRGKLPKTRKKWWRKKLLENKKRDQENIEQLKQLNWRIVIVWECSIRKKGLIQKECLDKIALSVADFLPSGRSFMEFS